MRIIPIQQFNRQTIDLDKIRADAGNPDLQESDIFDFPKFLICRNGMTANGDEISAEAQRSAVSQWVGKPIVIDHDLKHTNQQVGRIYDAWVEETNGETVTYGRAWALKAKDDKEKDLQKKIKNRQHREMSLAANINRAICSSCKSNLELPRFACPKGCPDGHPIHQDITPVHVSFVADPAVEGAGLVTHSSANSGDDQSLHRLAEDGRLFREWTTNEFSKWYRLNNKTISAEEIKTLTDKLSAREMLTFARIEQDRYREAIPSGEQQLTAPEETEGPVMRSVEEIKQSFRKGKTI